MVALTAVVITIFVYVLLLFGIATFGERASKKKNNIINNPFVYSLSLAVYCTSWTFYASVGSAANNGMLYLAIYLGPTICIVVWWNVLRKLVRIKNKFNITSIVDLIAARYSKSEGLGFLATAFIVFGIIPYIALQLKAIIKTIHILTALPEVTTLATDNVGLYVVLILIISSIFFGIRKLNVSERHPGMVLVMAFESIVKLAAFVSVGILVSYFMNNGINDLLDKIPSVEGPQFNIIGTGHKVTDAITWITYLILSSAAILFLPRMFHIAVIENNNEEHIKTAKWFFPLYLLMANIFVIPIAIGGNLAGLKPVDADYFVLLLAQLKQQRLFSLFVFIGGFSAATSMVMIETVTISTMITNNIFLPVFIRIKKISWMGRHLLKLRWASASLLVLSSYFFMNIVGEQNTLFSIGMIAFVAVLQFAPVTLGALYWKKGSRVGAYMGLGSGALIWFYTLVIPSLAKSGFISDFVLTQGLFGNSFLRPEALFGLGGLPYLSHATFWTMFFNITLFLFFSLFYPPTISEQKMAEEFINALPKEGNDDIELDSSHDTISIEEKKKQFFVTLSQFCSNDEANKIFQLSLSKIKAVNQEKISILKLAELYEDVERSLSGFIGTAASHYALKRATIISAEENEELTRTYGSLLASMKINPSELKKQIVLYLEKEKLMKYETQLMEETIRKKTAELEEQKGLIFQASKMAALGEMAAGIAHEINNPLSIIKLNNFLLRKVVEKGEPDKESIYRYSGNIDSTISRISKIIMGLMAISRDDRNEAFACIKLSDIFEDVLPFCKEKFKASGIEIKINIPPEIYQSKLHGSRVQLSQVLLNLLNNSFDAIEHLEERWIIIEAKIEMQDLILTVTDSGPGISRDIQDKVFQPFFTTKEVGRGTGLGLSLSSAIIRNHKGQMIIDNKNPHTCFIITLPSKAN